MEKHPRARRVAEPRHVTRRTALKAFGTASAQPRPCRGCRTRVCSRSRESRRPTRPPAPNSLAPQFQTLEALVEAIIPTDERSPGAKEARVADYIDLLLSEADRRWARSGWAASRRSTAKRRRGSARRSCAERRPVDAILADISRNERDPQTPLETFFVMTKQATILGYYTSEIGIHGELRYKGNVFLREFVGCQTEDGKDCPHCGQKHSKVEVRSREV